MLRKWNWRLSARQIAGKSPLDYALEAGNAEISGLFFGLTIASFQESCAHPRDHAALKKRSPRAENNPKTKDICHFQPFRSSMLQSFPGGWLPGRRLRAALNCCFNPAAEKGQLISAWWGWNLQTSESEFCKQIQLVSVYQDLPSSLEIGRSGYLCAARRTQNFLVAGLGCWLFMFRGQDAISLIYV